MQLQDDNPSADPAEPSAALFRSISVHQIRFLLDLYETRKLSESAANFGISPAAASRLLARLRDELRDPLFIYSQYGLHPTSFISMQEPNLRKLVANLDAFFALSGFSLEKLTKTFRIASASLTLPFFLNCCVKRALKEAPNVKFEVVQHSEKELEELADGRIDLAIMPEKGNLPASLCAVPLFRLERVILLRRNHPLKRRFSASPPTMQAYEAYPQLSCVTSPLYRSDNPSEGNVRAASTASFDLLPALEQSDFLMTVPKIGAKVAMDFHALDYLPLPLELQRRPSPPKHASMIFASKFCLDPAHTWLRGVLLLANKELLKRYDAD